MSEAATIEVTGNAARVITAKIHRLQRGHSMEFAKEPPRPRREPARKPARVAIMLVLAHKLQEAIDQGEVQDQADAARRLGITRARVTQLLDLTMLAPDIQEQVLLLESMDGVEPMSERILRKYTRVQRWSEQLSTWMHLRIDGCLDLRRPTST